jgi:tRNA(Ile)-lysidine synthase
VERAAAQVLRRAEPGGAALSVEALQRHPLAMRRRLLRLAAERAGTRLDFQHLSAVLGLLPGEAGARRPERHELPGGWVAQRAGGELRLQREPDDTGRRPKEKQPLEFEHRLAVPGEVQVAELGTVLRASLVAVRTEQPGYNQPQFLDPGRLPAELVVRNWRPGDRFWPAHTKSPRKVKALLQERRIAAPQRALWPVVAWGETIVWMRGFAAAHGFGPAPEAARALLIEELPAQAERGGA